MNGIRQRRARTAALAPPDQWQPARPLDAIRGPVLHLCARVALAPEQRAALAAAVARLGSDDWDPLLRQAQRHGLAPLAFKHLAETDLLPLAPVVVAGALKAAYAQSLVTNRIAWEELAACLAALERANVAAIPFKGVLLAARCYGVAALRPTADLDLLIRPADLARAEAAIRASGYEARAGWARRLDDEVVRFRVLQFEKAAAPPIELHLSLVRLPAYRLGLADAVIWGGARMVEVAGLRARALDEGDELRYLSAHYVAQHSGERLLWLADIAALVAALPPAWDWDAFIARTVALRMASPVLAALHLAAAELGAPVPAAALGALAAACATPRERAAWRRAHAKFATLGRAREQVVALGTARERLTFVRGIAGAAWRRGQRSLAISQVITHRPLSQSRAERRHGAAPPHPRDGGNGPSAPHTR